MLQRPQPIAQTLLAWIAMALVLSGCAPGMLDRGAAELEVQRAEAQRFEAGGDWAAAAGAWQRAADATRGVARDESLMAAAEAWLRAGQLEQARAALTAVSTDPGPVLAARRALNEARLLLRANRPEDALARLAGVPTAPGDPAAADLLATRGDAAFASRQAVIGVTAMVQREALLPDEARRAGNQRRIWNRLQEAAAAGISLETPRGTDPVVAAWLELGRALEAAGGNPFALRAGLVGWRQRHPAHPAAAGIVEALLAEYSAMTEYPRSIALLLPLGGRQGSAAAAVRDGFIAALIASGDEGGEGERPLLRIYDTVALGPSAAYEQAVRSGAEFVVGPLLKEEIAELVGAEVPAVPTLALNWADDGLAVPAHIFQFALAPEDEAAAVARRAALDGHQRAIALVQDSEQGRRMAQSFAAAFDAAGGELLGTQVFDPRVSDFSVEITSLLLLNESRARYQRIQAALGRRLEYEPRRREDADFLFLVAHPSAAFLIRPQLRFHYAGTLPIYATSMIFDPMRDDHSELDGVMFADMPWRVDAGGREVMDQFRAFGSTALERNGRLYAFGADAHRLVPLLHNRSASLVDGVEGLTGTLRIDDNGRIHRELDWGRFQRGRVRHAPPRMPAVDQPQPSEP
jgi:uncharacterized protein